MKLEPILTEKSLELAKEKKYSFRVGRNMTKHQIKKIVEKIYNVKVLNVWTLNEPGESKRGLTGRKRVIKPSKKAIIKVGEKDKIDYFEGKK
jgi:large subunit ribosomal protein L23